MKHVRHFSGAAIGLLAVSVYVSVSAAQDDDKVFGNSQSGKHLFETETFGGNGRTCSTCHSAETGTVSPEDAQRRFKKNPADPLFLHDGSDDFQGHGVTRMLKDATILVEIPLPDNVSLADDPQARSVVLRRGIPTTLNTPALDPVLMVDGRQPTLGDQAIGAIHDHAQGLRVPSSKELERIASFERSDAFFSSPALRAFARTGVAPALPPGVTASERRGRRFFEDAVDFVDLKHGACAACHSGPMLNETNDFAEIVFGIPKGTRFQTVGVSELNAAQNPVHDYVFTKADGTKTHVISPDPGRALITGVAPDDDAHFDNANAFKTPTLWGVHRTAPYFHDNSAKTLEDVAAHYNLFFSFTSDPDGPGPLPPALSLTPQDQADIVAYLKLLR
jgi:cytochrome c peroxidase